jgi:hypothetical protein
MRKFPPPRKKALWLKIARKRYLRRLRRKGKKYLSDVERFRKNTGGPKRRERLTMLEFIVSKMQGHIVGSENSNGVYIIPFPEVFSFIANPNETLDVIYTLSCVWLKSSVRSIYFDQRKCKRLDLDASAVLDMIVVEIKRNRSYRVRQISFQGRLPDDDRIDRLIRHTGLLKHLGMATNPAEEDNFVKFPLFRGRKRMRDEVSGEAMRGYATQALVDYVQNCLKAVGYSLGEDTQNVINEWAGEIICNCEDHSGRRNWFVIGYMDKTVPGVDGECQLVIFDFGKSIFESIESPGTSTRMLDKFRELASKHEQRGFFGLGASAYKREDLYTLYALQERVSRFSLGEGGVDRGTGTVQMIEAFQELRCDGDDREKPQMCLISGSSKILFDSSKYRMRSMAFPSGERRNVIAFNEDNDLEKRPDPNHVYSLKGFFPGTIISFRFFMDKRYLEKRVKNDKN